MREFVIVAIVIVLMSSCHNRKTEVRDHIEELMGKEIKFPSNTEVKYKGRDTIFSDQFKKDYKVLIYIDSTGCTSCKLRLFEWESIMEEAKPVKDKVAFLFFIHTKDFKELDYILQRDRFYYPVFFDRKNELETLNTFPKAAEFHTLLLDKDNKVVLVGNPAKNKKIWELYKQIIFKERES